MPSRENKSSTEPASERTARRANHQLWLYPLALLALLALITALSLPVTRIITRGWEGISVSATPWFSWMETFWGQCILLSLYIILLAFCLYLLYRITKGFIYACRSTQFFNWLRNEDQSSITPTLFKSVIVFAILGVGGGIITYNVSDNGSAWVELIAGAFTATGAMFAALLVFQRGEEDRLSRERTAQQELRTRRREGFGERMSAAIDHLISTNIGARAAGMVELAGLADDWHALAEEAKQDATSGKEKDRLTDEARRRQQELVDLIFKQPLPPLEPEATEVEIRSLQRTRSLIISNHCNEDENNWSFINFEGADLTHAELIGRDLSGWNLQGAVLDNANLQQARLNSANLEQAHLNNVDLGQAQLNNTDLGQAQLNNADLGEAQLNNADLGEAQLNNADMREAQLNNADLDNAQLTDARLWQAELYNADFFGVYLEKTVLSAARYSPGTLFPDGFVPEAHGLRKVEDAQDRDEDKG